MERRMTQTATAFANAPLAVFRVGQHICGLLISNIQEINKNLLLTPVHEAPDYVRGIINLRGNIVTVIDLRRKLGLDPIALQSSTRNVIVKFEREMVGLLVDAVDDIVEVASSDIRPTPAHLSKELGDAFEGVVQLGGELVAILQLEYLLDDTSSH
jgi:purine-binding chemotaxis protein CheW